MFVLLWLLFIVTVGKSFVYVHLYVGMCAVPSPTFMRVLFPLPLRRRSFYATTFLPLTGKQLLVLLWLLFFVSLGMSIIYVLLHVVMFVMSLTFFSCFLCTAIRVVAHLIMPQHFRVRQGSNCWCYCGYYSLFLLVSLSFMCSCML